MVSHSCKNQQNEIAEQAATGHTLLNLVNFIVNVTCFSSEILTSTQLLRNFNNFHNFIQLFLPRKGIKNRCNLVTMQQFFQQSWNLCLFRDLTKKNTLENQRLPSLASR